MRCLVLINGTASDAFKASFDTVVDASFLNNTEFLSQYQEVVVW